MRPSEIEHLKTLVEQKRSFKLIPYGSENILSFESRKGWWKITCLYMNIFPDTLEIVHSFESVLLSGYSEAGENLIVQFNLDNFFQVLAWLPAKEAKE